MKMLQILTPTIWICFAIYAIWYFTLAKHPHPITTNEAKILWKLHKQTTHCKAKKWWTIKQKNNLIGFKCQCGYQYIQKRPIKAKTPTNMTHSYYKPLEKLHTPYK